MGKSLISKSSQCVWPGEQAWVTAGERESKSESKHKRLQHMGIVRRLICRISPVKERERSMYTHTLSSTNANNSQRYKQSGLQIRSKGRHTLWWWDALGVAFALLASDCGFQLMLFTLIKRCWFFMERDSPEKGCKCVQWDSQALAKIYNCV